MREKGNHPCLSEDWLIDNLPPGWSYDCHVGSMSSDPEAQDGFVIETGDNPNTLFIPLRLLADPPKELKAGMEQFHDLASRYEFVARKAAEGFNYFVGYIDSGQRGQYGLSYGVADWVTTGIYMKDLHALIH
jgi:hypothetical protein